VQGEGVDDCHINKVEQNLLVPLEGLASARVRYSQLITVIDPLHPTVVVYDYLGFDPFKPTAGPGGDHLAFVDSRQQRHYTPVAPLQAQHACRRAATVHLSAGFYLQISGHELAIGTYCANRVRAPALQVMKKGRRRIPVIGIQIIPFIK